MDQNFEKINKPGAGNSTLQPEVIGVSEFGAAAGIIRQRRTCIPTLICILSFFSYKYKAFINMRKFLLSVLLSV